MAVDLFVATGLRPNPPIIIPSAGSPNQNSVPEPRSCALGRISVFAGPAVLIATVTVCVPLAPTAIVGLEQLAPGGNPAQAKLTADTNVVAPTGLTTTL
jgi:hypothetical protein